MISPALYNMLLYRSFHGRREHWRVPESIYDKLRGAFGRMPIVLHLGDFLQLRPTNALSLLDDLRAKEEEGVDIAAEYQEACRLFKRTPLCFELVGTNRFRDARLRELVEFMRAPASTLPESIKETWRRIQMTTLEPDPRLQAARFQCGHMLGIYWETVARWVFMRAERDAKALQTPLLLLQAADVSSPVMSAEMAAKLMNHFNPHETGHLHGMLPLHLGMHVRLIETLDKTRGAREGSRGYRRACRGACC